MKLISLTIIVHRLLSHILSHLVIHFHITFAMDKFLLPDKTLKYKKIKQKRNNIIMKLEKIKNIVFSLA